MTFVQTGQLGEPVDDAFGDSVTDMFQLGVPASILKGQHCNGIDGLFQWSRSSRPEQGDGQQNQHQHSPSQRRPKIAPFRRVCRRYCCSCHRLSRGISFQTLEVEQQLLGALAANLSISFSRVLLMMPSSGPGSFELSLTGAVGALFKISSKRTAVVLPSKGNRPVAIS